nr:hypothetical protein [uncultured Blautia sp.]
MNKNIFLCKETTFQNVNGFELLQIQNEKIICKQFIAKDSFCDFIRDAGINQNQIKYI